MKEVLDYETLKVIKAETKKVGEDFLMVGWPLISGNLKSNPDDHWRQFLFEQGVIEDIGMFCHKPNCRQIGEEFFEKKISSQRRVYRVDIARIDHWLENLKRGVRLLELEGKAIVEKEPL